MLLMENSTLSKGKWKASVISWQPIETGWASYHESLSVHGCEMKCNECTQWPSSCFEKLTTPLNALKNKFRSFVLNEVKIRLFCDEYRSNK